MLRAGSSLNMAGSVGQNHYPSAGSWETRTNGAKPYMQYTCGLCFGVAATGDQRGILRQQHKIAASRHHKRLEKIHPCIYALRSSGIAIWSIVYLCRRCLRHISISRSTVSSFDYIRLMSNVLFLLRTNLPILSLASCIRCSLACKRRMTEHT